MDRFFVLAILLMAVLEESLPSVAGFSATSLAVLGGFAWSVSRVPSHFLRVAGAQPVLAVLSLLPLLAIIEWTSPVPDFGVFTRIGLLLLGAVSLSVLSAGERGFTWLLRSVLWSYVTAAILFLDAAWGAMRAGVFAEGFRVRLAESLAGSHFFVANLNRLGSYFGLAGALALAVVLSSRRDVAGKRLLFLIVLSAPGLALLTMSRGGVLTVVAAYGAVGMAHIRRSSRGLRSLLLLVGASVMLIAAFELRGVGRSTGEDDLRLATYEVVVNEAASLAPSGVGYGTYWSSWAEERGLFSIRLDEVVGVHSSFGAWFTYWGLFGLSSLVVIIAMVRRGLVRQTKLSSAPLLHRYVALVTGAGSIALLAFSESFLSKALLPVLAISMWRPTLANVRAGGLVE